MSKITNNSYICLVKTQMEKYMNAPSKNISAYFEIQLVHFAILVQSLSAAFLGSDH